MNITNASEAAAYVQAWEATGSEMNAARFRRLAGDMRACQGLCQRGHDVSRQAYQDAERVLLGAAERLEWGPT